MLKAHIGTTIGLCTNHFSQPQHQLLKFCKFAAAPRDVIFTNSCASRWQECGDAAPECQVTEGDSSNEECSDPPVRAMTQVRLLTRSVWRPRTREGGLCRYGVSGEVAVVLRAARLPLISTQKWRAVFSGRSGPRLIVQVVKFRHIRANFETQHMEQLGRFRFSFGSSVWYCLLLLVHTCLPKPHHAVCWLWWSGTKVARRLTHPHPDSG